MQGNGSMQIRCIYVNRDSEIDRIKEEYMDSSNGEITREDLLSLLKGNSRDNGLRYSILYILKYNISTLGNEFLTPIRKIESVAFENPDDDLKELILVYFEADLSNPKTKRVYLETRKTRRR
jgi:hypothetical protein